MEDDGEQLDYECQNVMQSIRMLCMMVEHARHQMKWFIE